MARNATVPNREITNGIVVDLSFGNIVTHSHRDQGNSKAALAWPSHILPAFNRSDIGLIKTAIWIEIIDQATERSWTAIAAKPRAHDMAGQVGSLLIGHWLP